jgi:hypothetical protein
MKYLGVGGPHVPLDSHSTGSFLRRVSRCGTRQRASSPCGTIFFTVYCFLALGEERPCRVPKKIHSAKAKVHGKDVFSCSIGGPEVKNGTARMPDGKTYGGSSEGKRVTFSRTARGKRQKRTRDIDSSTISPIFVVVLSSWLTFSVKNMIACQYLLNESEACGKGGAFLVPSSPELVLWTVQIA